MQHKNEALKTPPINHKIGMACLSAADPRLVTRTWSEVMDDILLDQERPTLPRRKITMLRSCWVAHSGSLFIACIEFENHELGIFL